MKKRLPIVDIFYIATISILVAACAIMGVFLGLSKKGNNAFKSYYDQHVETYQVENANFSKGQIIFIGDSITDLYHLDDYYGDLDKAVYNRGIGGDTTDGVIKRLKVSLYDLHPSEIVLMIGINDLNGGKTVEQVTNNYQFILNDIKTTLPTTKVFTMSIISMSDLMSGAVDVVAQNSKVMEVNTHINDMAVAKGYTYVDLFSQVKDENNKLQSIYTDDGIHLNAAGFTVWTNILKPLL